MFRMDSWNTMRHIDHFYRLSSFHLFSQRKQLCFCLRDLISCGNACKLVTIFTVGTESWYPRNGDIPRLHVWGNLNAVFCRMVVTCYRVITLQRSAFPLAVSSNSHPSLCHFLKRRISGVMRFHNDTSHFIFVSCYYSDQLATFHNKRRALFSNRVLSSPK